MATSDVAPLGLRERKKQQTRERIATTARALFVERGFDAVRVAEVAHAADVSEQTVFNYFPTKEELVFWRLGAFEAQLLGAVRERPPGEPALAAFARFLLDLRGLLGKADPGARDQLAAVARMIDASPALRAREQQIFTGFTASLAALLAEEQGVPASDISPRVAANAMMGVHRSLVEYTRRRVLEGVSATRLQRDVRAQADAAFALLSEGFGDYAPRPPAAD